MLYASAGASAASSSDDSSSTPQQRESSCVQAGAMTNTQTPGSPLLPGVGRKRHQAQRALLTQRACVLCAAPTYRLAAG